MAKGKKMMDMKKMDAKKKAMPKMKKIRKKK